MVFSFTEYTLEGGAGEPNDVASCVHINRESLRVESEGKCVVTARCKREGDLLVGVATVSFCGDCGGGF